MPHATLIEEYETRRNDPHFGRCMTFGVNIKLKKDRNT